MRLVTNTEVFAPVLGHKETIRLIARAGFDAIDWSFFREFDNEIPWLQDGWKDYAKEMLDTASQCGICFRQAHAPFPSSRGEEPYDTEILPKLRRCIEVCGALGIRHLVIHPCAHLPYNIHREELFEMSLQLYRELLPLAQEHQVVLCTENMWWRDKGRKVIVESVCARPEEFCAMIDEIDSPWLAGCLDIGHCGLVSQDPAYMIRALGHRLQALHVHDVDLLNDSHTIPFAGKTDWASVTAALGEIDYRGDLTFETGGWFVRFPQELWLDAARMLERTGRYLISQVEANRKKA